MYLDVIGIGLNFAEAVYVLSEESPYLKEPFAVGFSCYQPTDVKEIFVNAIHPT